MRSAVYVLDMINVIVIIILEPSNWNFCSNRKYLWEFPCGLVVKDPALSLLWHRFEPRPRNFYVLWAQPKKKKKLEIVFTFTLLAVSEQRSTECNIRWSQMPPLGLWRGDLSFYDISWFNFPRNSFSGLKYPILPHPGLTCPKCSLQGLAGHPRLSDTNLARTFDEADYWAGSRSGLQPKRTWEKVSSQPAKGSLGNNLP